MTSYDQAGVARRLVRRVVTLGPVARVSARVLPGVDRVAVRLTRRSLSGWVTGLPVVELTTTGARSGQPRRHRVLGVPAEDGYLVVAANFGEARLPSWYFNLRAHRRVDVDGRPYDARELTGAEREAGFARALELNPGWRRFADRAGRPIPVLRLTARA